LVGRPNVGKSSLVNALLNEDRVIVSDISGTTRDSIDTPFTKDGVNYNVIDTAGLKKRGKIYESIDKFSAIRALRAIERSEIILLVIDGNQGITEQDKHVIQYATDLHKAIIIVVNKWDLVTKETNTMSDFTKLIRKEYKFLEYAPVVFVSAKNKSRLDTIFKALVQVHNAYHTRVKTSLLNQVMQDAQAMNQTPHFNGGRLKILYASQVSSAPPTFVLFVNNPEFMHFSYQRYLENRLRETFDFDGTPINIVCRPKGKKD
jgi:GTP-binding protein